MSLTKLLFPKSKINKRQVLTYYTKIAPHFLHLSRHYPIVMQRYPEGITGKNFFQKQIPDYFPDWINHQTVELKKGGDQTLVVIENQPTLEYLANQDVLVFHSWLSQTGQITHPTKLVFDLDPAEVASSTHLKDIHQAAKALKALLESYSLTPFLMTTGSRGYHVVVPIIPQYTFEEVHEFAKKIATKLADQAPDKFTTAISKSKRGERIFIDYLRNSYGQTAVAPYSLRAIEGAPVATPIDWFELDSSTPQKYTLKNMFSRLSHKIDPWQNFAASAKELPKL